MFKKIILIAFFATFVASTSNSVKAADLGIAFGVVGKDVEVLKGFLDTFNDRTGHNATIVPMPSSTSDQFGQYKLWLSAKNSGIDLYMLDVIWAPQLANHFVDLSKDAASLAKKHFPSIIQSQTVNDRLVALPFFTDAPMLYYRKDLLEMYDQDIPKTWEELTRVASVIQTGERARGNDKMWGFVFQGKAYEGLTCDALEWINSYGGGQIVEPDGEISVNNPRAVKALKMVRGWIGTISPEGVTSYQEEESRGVWQVGNAVFMRNWPYAYSLGNSADSPIKGKFDVVPLPKGSGANSKSAATLGGWNVGVSKYSKNIDAAVELAMFLASEEMQKRLAIESSHYPTIDKLYRDKDVLEVAPFFPVALEVLRNSVARPSAPTKRKYNETSKEFWTAVQKAISGAASPEKSLRDLERRLTIIKGAGW